MQCWHLLGQEQSGQPSSWITNRRRRSDIDLDAEAEEVVHHGGQSLIDQ